ncbi:hypothetical protein MRX96_058260 [Rhipicephalus microplus]
MLLMLLTHGWSAVALLIVVKDSKQGVLGDAPPIQCTTCCVTLHHGPAAVAPDRQPACVHSANGFPRKRGELRAWVQPPPPFPQQGRAGAAALRERGVFFPRFPVRSGADG